MWKLNSIKPKSMSEKSKKNNSEINSKVSAELAAGTVKIAVGGKNYEFSEADARNINRVLSAVLSEPRERDFYFDVPSLFSWPRYRLIC